MSGSLNMLFEDYFELYKADVIGTIRLNTWMTKEHMIRTKIIMSESEILKSFKISLSIEPPYKKTLNIFYDKENGKGMKSTRKSSLKFCKITCPPKWSPKV